MMLFSAMSAGGFVANAQTSNYGKTAQKELFNFEKYSPEKVIEYFKELNDQGRKFPTNQEFKEKFGVDPEFIRSHTRLRPVLRGTENPLLFPNLREDRNLWMNLPTGIGTLTGGYPSGQFDNDPYTMWQYTELFGSWNHSFFQAPGSWVDAAHKHGTTMMSGIKFFDTTGGRQEGAGSYMSFLTSTNADGSYTYVKPYIHILMFLGQDGINYNWEASGYNDQNVVNFHKALSRYAKEIGFTEYRQGIYTSQSRATSNYISNWMYDSQTRESFGDIMLNYWGGDFADQNGTSGELAKSTTGKYDHLYSGVWIVTMNRAFQAMENVQTNLCLWGEHGQSRFVQFNTGSTATQKMSNYQQLYERAFSGTSRNPGKKDDWNISDFEGTQLATFGGLSRMIPERTTLKQNLPFQTYFNTGAGDRYYYKGLTATKSTWYSMGAQDYQPTYRWLQYQTGTTTPTDNVNVSFHYDDAYIGGTSLILTGQTPETGVDILLYRGLLTVSGANPEAVVNIKKIKGDRVSHLSLILHKKGTEATNYIELPLSDLQGATWEYRKMAITGIATGDVIDMIGLRLKGTPADYEMLVGGIGLYDNTKMAGEMPQPTNLSAEVRAETQKSMSIKLSWSMDKPAGVTATRESYGLLFNDELNIDHFEVFYKNGENGKIRELARTSSWATYVPTILFDKTKDEADYEQPYIGVRAVSTDLKTGSKITWIKVDRAETYELPEFKDDRYCKSEINPKAEGYNIAIVQRYLEYVKTEGATTNLNYTASAPDADGDNYVDATKTPFVVNQGQNLTFKFKAHETTSGRDDGLRYCWAATYIDWNNNGVFEPELGEGIDELSLGNSRRATPEFYTEVSKQFQVPEDATPGKVRVRIVFSDAWFPKPVPCGFTAKGFTIDFDMVIQGDNPGRQAVDTRDQGNVEDLSELQALPVDHVTIQESNYTKVYPNPVHDVLFIDNADKAWVYTINGQLVKFVKNQHTIDMSDLSDGTYVVKTESKNVSRVHKVVKK